MVAPRRERLLYSGITMGRALGTAVLGSFRLVATFLNFLAIPFPTLARVSLIRCKHNIFLNVDLGFQVLQVAAVIF